MKPAFLRRGLAVSAVAVAAALASCETGPSKAEIEAARIAAEAEAAARPVPIALNQGVADSASVYLAFTRDMATIEGGFESAEAVQAALRRGAAYDPAQISEGLVAYASILALQSPEFLAGIRAYGNDAATRQQLVNRIVANPGYASTLDGADMAAGLIMATLETEIDALADAAGSVENDAYAIQERLDPRRSWAVAHLTNRDERLAQAKALSGQRVAPSPADASNLLAAARAGTGLSVTSGRARRAPYPAAVNNALAIAALAALGAAGEDAVANTRALQRETKSQTCLETSKLMLYQCLAASRPSYEDMFCLGRHVVRDFAACAKDSSIPAPIIEISAPTDVVPPRPRVTTAPLSTPPLAQTPAPAARQTPAPPAPARAQSATERLNTTPGG